MKFWQKWLLFMACVFGGNIYGEGQYHFSLSHRQIFSYPEHDFKEPNNFGGLQAYIGVSGWDQYGYGNFEIGQDLLANFSIARFTLAFGQTVTFGPEIHAHYDNGNREWGWGTGPTIHYNSQFFTLSIGYPFDFGTCAYEEESSSGKCPFGTISGIELVIRGQLPVSDKDKPAK